MTGETIEARVLQEKTRDLLDLLEKIHKIPPDSALPVAEVGDFIIQVGTIFAGVQVGRSIFQSRQDCYIPWPVDLDQGRELKK